MLFRKGDIRETMLNMEPAPSLPADQDAYSRQVMESLGEALIVADLDRAVIGGNRRAADMYGFKKGALFAGFDICELFARSERTRAARDFQQVLETGHSGLLEYAGVKKDGGEFPVEVSVGLVKGDCDRPAGFVVTSRDVTRRQQEHLALRESEERYRSIFESANDIIIVLDRKGHILDANHRVEAIAGFERKDLVGHDFRTLTRIITKKSMAILAVNYAKRLVGINVPPYEVELYNKNGERLDVEVNAVPLRVNGKIVGDLAILRDITEQKHTIQAVKESEEKFSTAFQVSPNACSITRLEDGTYIEINDSFTQITGYTREEIIGSTARQLNLWVDETEGKKIRTLLRKYGCVKNEDITLRTRSGEICNGIYSGEIVTISGQECVLVTISDITDRKRMEDKLRRAIIEADAANQAKGDFLARMSHEIRTPIHGVMGTLDLLRDTELGPEQRQYVSMARTSAETLLSVINDILDFSKIEAGKIKLENAVFNLRRTAEESLATVALLAHKKGLEVLLQAARDVPACVVGDAVRLHQIMVNLLGNAIKFTEKGEIVLGVALEAAGEADVELHFTVRDTGIGIPEDKQGVLFHPFEQVDGSNSRRYGGSGLGLSICKQLVELMGGRIWFTSRPGEGSVFHFTARFGKHTGAESGGLPALPKELNGLPLLVVDDNATSRVILSDKLKEHGFQVTGADGMLSALEQLDRAGEASRAVRLVLLDKTLPETDVYAAARYILRDPARRPALVMMLPSDSIGDDFARCREAGISRYLLKPIKEAELLDILLSALAPSQAADNPARQVAMHDMTMEKPLCILVAEDNVTSQLIARKKLEKAGHSVHIAKNGVEAVRMATEGEFDLVLMDVEMPEMDGLTATGRIRELEKQSGRHIPILAMTAYAMKEDKQKCLEAGMDAYLPKPVNLDEMNATIRAVSSTQYSGAEIFDVDAALELVGGDEDILKEVVGVFLEHDYPEQYRRLKDAVDRKDAATVKAAAHSVKGAVSSFGSRALSDTAMRLQEMGRSNDLAGAEAALRKMEKEIGQFTEAFTAYSRHGAGAVPGIPR